MRTVGNMLIGDRGWVKPGSLVQVEGGGFALRRDVELASTGFGFRNLQKCQWTVEIERTATGFVFVDAGITQKLPSSHEFPVCVLRYEYIFHDDALELADIRFRKWKAAWDAEHNAKQEAPDAD